MNKLLSILALGLVSGVAFAQTSAPAAAPKPPAATPAPAAEKGAGGKTIPAKPPAAAPAPGAEKGAPAVKAPPPPAMQTNQRQ